jgi:hypothetical protein
LVHPDELFDHPPDEHHPPDELTKRHVDWSCIAVTRWKYSREEMGAFEKKKRKGRHTMETSTARCRPLQILGDLFCKREEPS